jgi:predicted nucleic acid-binding protein
VVIHFDANFLIAVVRSDESARNFQQRVGGAYINISAVAWSEFLCGPVAPHEALQARSIVDEIEPLGRLDAEAAADLFNRTGRRLRSLRDCMIAAVAIRCGATLATANLTDFRPFEPFGLSLL